MRISDWSSDVCSSDLRTTELFDGWLRIADQLQFARDPALLDSLAIGCEFVAFTTRCYGGESSFGGQHARFHRGVTALDARHIDEASRTADERHARGAEFRHCLPFALVRSEERRGGNERVGGCKSRWWP